MTQVDILVPVLRRPHRVRPLLESIAAATPEPHHVFFIPDPDDHDEREEILAAGGNIVCELAGNYAAKINAAAALTQSPYLFLGADDLHFHSGWLPAALSKMTDGIGVVGTQDLCNRRVIRGQHATHSLIARWYIALGTIDEPGRILHEGYPHEYCDDELVGTAKRRGAWAFSHDAIVEHLHPDAGKAPMDDLYAGRHRRMRWGARIFRERRHLWT